MGSCLPGSGEGHIETPGVVQEPNALVLVGTHTGQDDEVLLPALEGVHTGNLHFLKETMPCQPQSCLAMEKWRLHGLHSDNPWPWYNQHKITRAPPLPHVQDMAELLLGWHQLSCSLTKSYCVALAVLGSLCTSVPAGC